MTCELRVFCEKLGGFEQERKKRAGGLCAGSWVTCPGDAAEGHACGLL